MYVIIYSPSLFPLHLRAFCFYRYTNFSTSAKGKNILFIVFSNFQHFHSGNMFISPQTENAHTSRWMETHLLTHSSFIVLKCWLSFHLQLQLMIIFIIILFDSSINRLISKMLEKKTKSSQNKCVIFPLAYFVQTMKNQSGPIWPAPFVAFPSP